METGRSLSVNKFLILGLIFLLVSCKDAIVSERVKPDFPDPENGDIIYRHGNGLFSSYFKNTSKREQIYSHAGIVSVSGDSIYVIHSEASEFTGIGGVKKETLNVFLSGISTWALYRVDTIQSVRDSIALIASGYEVRNVPFDFYFDNSTDDKIYCTELVAISVNKALKYDLIIPSGSLNGRPYYAVDDTYLTDKIKLVIRFGSDF